MPPGKGRRGAKPSAAEWRLLASLLPLLRSGSAELKACLGAGASSAPKKSSQGAGKASKVQSKEETPVMEPGWKVVKKKAKLAPEGETEQSAPRQMDELLPQGFNAEPVRGVAALTRDRACVTLASLAEAKKAKEELNSSLPMAVLSTQKLNGEGEEIACLVKDKNGKLQTRTCFLVRLGANPVLHNLNHVATDSSAGEERQQVVILWRKKKLQQKLGKQLSKPQRRWQTAGSRTW